MIQPHDLDDRAAARGVLSRALLDRRGLTQAKLTWCVHTGALRRLHRGVYVCTPGVSALQRVWAAAVAGGRTAIPSHLTAAAAHGLWLPPRHEASPAEVTHADGSARHARDRLRTSRAHLAEAEVTQVDGGLLVTSPPRTVADVLRRHGRLAAVLAAESALRRGLLTPDEAPAVIQPLIEVGSQSPLETAIRLLCHDAGIHLVTQCEVWDELAGCRRYIDLADPARRVAIEADGRATHDDPKALYDDRWRQNVLVLAGWIVLRFTWWDVLNRPAYVVSTVRKALARAA